MQATHSARAADHGGHCFQTTSYTKEKNSSSLLFSSSSPGARARRASPGIFERSRIPSLARRAGVNTRLFAGSSNQSATDRTVDKMQAVLQLVRPASAEGIPMRVHGILPI